VTLSQKKLKKRESAERARKIHRVIVVEDDTMVSAALVVLLQGMGMTVEVFSTATAAIERAGEFNEETDFYLTDFRLPDLSGLELLETLRLQSRRKIRGAILTGDTSPDRIETIKSSAWPVLFKPVEPERLFEVMEEAGNGQLKVL